MRAYPAVACVPRLVWGRNFEHKREYSNRMPKQLVQKTSGAYLYHPYYMY